MFVLDLTLVLNFCLTICNIFTQGEAFEEKLLGLVVAGCEALPQCLMLGAVCAHWHREQSLTSMELFATTVNIPLRSLEMIYLCITNNPPFSISYLTFYCNPNLKSAVVGKILMEGIGAAGALYGSYIEKYMHTETPVLIPPPEDFIEEEKSWIYYDVSNPLKCLLLQCAYFMLIPYFGLKELLIIMKDAYVRDVHQRIK